MKKVSKARKAILDAPIMEAEARAVGWDKVMENYYEKLKNNRDEKEKALAEIRRARAYINGEGPLEILTLRELFRAMEPMRKEDEFEDETLTDDERDSLRFRESV
jgi:hypothetical protein